MTATLLRLAALFGGLSLLALGGGNGVIPDMRRAAVARAWQRPGWPAAWARVERALAPVAIGLTLGSGLALLVADNDTVLLLSLTAGSTVLLVLTPLNPLPVLLAAAAIAAAYGTT